MGEKLHFLEDVARHYGVDTRTLRRWIPSHKRFYLTPHSVRIKDSVLRQFEKFRSNPCNKNKKFGAAVTRRK